MKLKRDLGTEIENLDTSQGKSDRLSPPLESGSGGRGLEHTLSVSLYNKLLSFKFSISRYILLLRIFRYSYF